MCFAHNKRIRSVQLGNEVFQYLPVGLFILKSSHSSARLTTLFTTKGSAKTIAKITQWSVKFLEINFQTEQAACCAKVCSRMQQNICPAFLMHVSQGLLISKQYINAYICSCTKWFKVMLLFFLYAPPPLLFSLTTG